MAYADTFRFWFIGLYCFGFGAFGIMVARLRPRRGMIEKKKGPLPTPGILIPLGIPLLILVTQFGEMNVAFFSLRLAAAVLSGYFLIMMPWMMSTLGRFAVPGSGVYSDHRLVTTGPYRYLRHPLYSAAIVLWLSAGLGTVNWLLLALWPLFAIASILLPVRHEEELLREKFGAEYERYAAQTARLIPGVF
ncbi:MAG: isoprenylcysteine carboxylmethyltransferase family protein [Rhodothermales bacterium]